MISQGGGLAYPDTVSGNDLYSNTTKYVKLRDEIELSNSYSKHLYNYTASTSKGSINVRGTSNGGVRFYLLRGTSLLNPNKLYTLVCEFSIDFPVEELSNNVKILPINGNNRIYYYNRLESLGSNKYRNIVITSTNETSSVYVDLGRNDAYGSKAFSITLHFVAVYEGAFTNPPFTKSLDVQPSNQFLCNSKIDKCTNNLIRMTTTVNGYYKVIPILILPNDPTMLDGGSLFTYGSIFWSHPGVTLTTFVEWKAFHHLSTNGMHEVKFLRNYAPNNSSMIQFNIVEDGDDVKYWGIRLGNNTSYGDNPMIEPHIIHSNWDVNSIQKELLRKYFSRLFQTINYKTDNTVIKNITVLETTYKCNEES